MYYRKKYEKHHNIKLSKDYDVHHIDGNHDNDDIDNLIALPKIFHRVLHSEVGLLPKKPLDMLVKLYEESKQNFTTNALANWLYVRLDKVGVPNDVIIKNKKEIKEKKLIALGQYRSNGFY